MKEKKINVYFRTLKEHFATKARAKVTKTLQHRLNGSSRLWVGGGVGLPERVLDL